MSERQGASREQVLEQFLGAGTWEIDLATTSVTWSAGARRILELGAEARTSVATLIALVHPDDRPRLEAAYERAVGHRTPFQLSHRLRFADGRVKHVLHAGGPAAADPGSTARYCGALQDLTGRVAADAAHGPETELPHSEELLKQAVNVSGIGIFDHDQVTGSIYWSRRLRAMHGWGPDEPLTVEKCAGAVHPDDVVRVAESVRRAHDPSGAGVWEVEYRIVRPDGSVRWMVGRARTFFEGDGAARRAVRTVGALLDMTERKIAEEAMRIKDQAIATSLTATTITDEAGRIAYANPAFVKMWGYDSETEVLGRTATDFADGEPAARALEALRSMGYYQGELTARRRDGSPFSFVFTANALRDADGNLTNLIASLLDVSQERRMQEQLYQAQKMESVGRLAGGVAHDFNNLLTVMRGYLDFAVRDLGPEDTLRLDLEEVLKAVSSATTLTQQLLSFSRRQVIKPQLLDLNQVIEHVYKMLRRLLGEDIELRVAGGASLWPIRFDAGQCEQVLINLAANARDAMPRGGRLLLETQNLHIHPSYAQSHPGCVPGDYVVLAVCDNGVGMSKEVQRHIFEPFYTTKGPGAGTGLGLAMVYGAVQQNDGRIEVHSEAGHGTCFKIYLPRAEGGAAPVERESAVWSRPKCGETIVLVEDEASVRTLAARLLSDWGFRVHSFPDGASALEFVSSSTETVHLLVTDVVMPGIDGRELADKLRSMRPALRVLLTSGYTANAMVQQGAVDDCADFLAKPYSIESLGKRVREILDRPGNAAAARTRRKASS
jgi:PAS domain S-box-containing protein